MAITKGVNAVCTTPVDGAVVATAAFSATGGRLLSVKIAGEPDSGALTSVTISDTGSNSYTDRSPVGTGGRRGRTSWVRNSTTNAAFVVTATMAGAVPVYGFTIEAVEWIGAKTSGDPVNLYGGQSQSAVGSGTDAVTTGALGTPSVAGCVVDGASACNNLPDNFTVGTGYTLLDGTDIGFAYASRFEYLIQTSAAAVAATFTSDGGGDHITWATVYEPDAGGGTTPSSSDAGTLTDRATGIELSTQRDTGTLVDRVTGIALDGQRDTGSAVDRPIGVALDGQRDTGTLSETSVLDTGSVPKSSSDSATLADDVSDIQIDDGPEGTLTERVSGIALSGPADTGAFVDRNSITATLTAVDSATLGESSSITQTGTNPADSQTIAFSESGQITVSLVTSDNFTEVERNGALSAGVSGSDQQAMGDAIAALLASLSSADSAQALEASSVQQGGGAAGVLTGRVSFSAAVGGSISLFPVS